MSLSYLIKETIRTIKRNFNHFLLSSTVMAICLLITTVFFILTINLIKLAQSAATHVEIYAFVSDEISCDPSPLFKRIVNISGISSIRFVTKAEAMEELRQMLREDTTLINAVGENPIPASIRISLQPDYATRKNLAQIEEKLLRLPGVIEVWSGKELINQLNQAIRTVVILNILILIIVTGSVLFITFQTVEYSISRRSQEIEIMELVGASRFAIQFPFILQGTIQGLLGSIITFIIVYVIYRITASLLPHPYFPTFMILMFTLISGILLGIGGSVLALSHLPTTLVNKPIARRLH